MITVKDIREKEFSKQKHGYHEDEVDDFLDEIADQMEELIRENRSLLGQLEEAQARASAQPAPAAQPEPVAVSAPRVEQPPVDEPSYFRNLEATLRETLLSAQRIADNTVAEARGKAKELVSGAETQAKQLISSAQEQAGKIAAEATDAAASARAEYENFKKAHQDYKARFLRMVKDQLASLQLDDELDNPEEDKPE